MQPDKVRIEPWQIAERKSEFPSKADSKKMRTGALWMVWRHKLFCTALALTMLGLVWLLHADSWLLLTAAPESGVINAPFLTAMREPLSGLWQIPTILRNRPGTLVIFVLVLYGFYGFASSGARQPGSRWKSLLLGMLHFAIQLGAAIFVAVIVEKLLGRVTVGLVRDLLFLVFAVPAGTVLNGLLFGSYLYLANCFLGWHEQEVYSSQAIQNWKCFLRMKVSRDCLTIYPIGLREVETVWERTLQSATAPAGWIAKMKKAVRGFFFYDRFEVPKGTTHLYRPGTQLAPELIEVPVEIAKESRVQKVSAASPIFAPKLGRGGAKSEQMAAST
jgi:hypothetical protein